MAEQMTTDVRALLDRDPFDASAVTDLYEVLGRDPSRYKTLRDAVSAMYDREKGAMSPAVHLRLGVAEVMMGKFAPALENLAKAGDVGLAHHFRAWRSRIPRAGPTPPRRSPRRPRRGMTRRSRN